MKLFYTIILGLMVLVSACAQQTSPAAQTAQPIQAAEQPTVVDSQQGETEAAGETAVQETNAQEMEETKTASGDVRIVGKEGFDPMEMAISAGDAVTWVNDDKKDLVMAFFKDGKFYINSAVIKPGENFEHEFKAEGSYVYRTLAYGVEGKLTVQ